MTSPAGDAVFRPESQAAFRRLKWLGLAGAWNRNHGIRIDHLLLSPQAADRLGEVTIHRAVRARDKPSDHVPVVAELRE